MNSYELKMQAKKERFAERAQTARQNSESLYKKGSAMFEAIPFGQPILVGHHSEKGDRAYRGRAGRLMDRSIEEDKKADYYEEKAERIGKGGISSDDPGAIEKLQEKLKKLVAGQELMKKANAIIRNSKLSADERLNELSVYCNFTAEQAQKLLEPDFCGRIGFASYALTNNNATIRNTMKRIEELKKIQNRTEAPEVTGNGWKMKEDTEENRIMFIFDGKPAENIRAILKGWGFKWSPNRSAWVRMLTANGQYATKRVIEKLNNL